MPAQWVALTTYASGFEADWAIARLAAAEIPALRDSNDSVGIFGPGFQGATARGVTVMVPDVVIDEARLLLLDADEVVDDLREVGDGQVDVDPANGTAPP